MMKRLQSVTSGDSYDRAFDWRRHAMIRLVRSFSATGALLMLSGSGCYVESGPPPPQQAVVYQQPPPPPPQQEVVYEQEPPAPPPPQPEVVPAAPGPDYLWIHGYHRWDGHRYVWAGGRYERRPHANARYAPAHWEARGRGHAWVEGRWE
jgi:hypothetical protein